MRELTWEQKQRVIWFATNHLSIEAVRWAPKGTVLEDVRGRIWEATSDPQRILDSDTPVMLRWKGEGDGVAGDGYVYDSFVVVAPL